VTPKLESDLIRLEAALLDSGSPINERERDQLEGAQIEGAQLEGAQLEGAQPEGAQLEGAQLEGAQLHRTSFVPHDVIRCRAGLSRVATRVYLSSCKAHIIAASGPFAFYGMRAMLKTACLTMVRLFSDCTTCAHFCTFDLATSHVINSTPAGVRLTRWPSFLYQSTTSTSILHLTWCTRMCFYSTKSTTVRTFDAVA
jgi:hypothetical protein